MMIKIGFGGSKKQLLLGEIARTWSQVTAVPRAKSSRNLLQSLVSELEIRDVACPAKTPGSIPAPQKETQAAFPTALLAAWGLLSV